MFSNWGAPFLFLCWSLYLFIKVKCSICFSIASPNLYTHITLQIMDLHCHKYPNKLCNLWIYWENITDYILPLFVSPLSLQCLVQSNSLKCLLWLLLLLLLLSIKPHDNHISISLANCFNLRGVSKRAHGINVLEV